MARRGFSAKVARINALAAVGLIWVLVTAQAGQDKNVLELVASMETRLSVRIVTPTELIRGPESNEQETVVKGAPAIAPDATAIAWWLQPFPERGGAGTPFITVELPNEGSRPVWLNGYFATGEFGISSRAELIVVKAHPIGQRRLKLLSLNLRNGVTVQDLTPFVTEFELPTLEQISVSGPGTLVALGSREKIQVLEIPSGSTVLSERGRFPRLSPDGTRLAFVSEERLLIRPLSDSSTHKPFPDLHVMGLGGWSPDGRFLLAGAWTKRFALEKRQVVFDTVTSQYAEIGKLGDGDYGDGFAWISAKLTAH
jgi:WD40-like Beta Propeller Repeat